MDTIYPEPVSQIYRRMDRRKNGRLASRYRTLPVTFSEIKEVDEENIEDRDDDSQYESSSALTDNCADVSRVTSLETAAASAGIVSSKSDHDLKTRFGDHPTLGGGGGETQLRRRQRPTMKSVNRKLRLGDAAADPPSNGDQRSSPTRSSLTPRMSI
ncbi:uncharacterized protein LOC111054708 isoform X2 [Nilaparvata lugens]|uniref:uncharacterized protein LOC111054708 isoform X2 n=1 Tax=Nilaparvata lugens TaxID=108931 RepID=UPI00193DBC31|nr:uncharacterized protein LOC111054708 isoform X2 [Nilaparvata lugens]XP_039295183.1 uncharacterized protein LOC111054708 isoform X1 [Nilaparvata lugens]XP_039295184.1 uncharacterized protein LOC111054708 isoform X2 [Nilaparvata lugens]